MLVLKLADEANIPLLDALATVTSHPAAVARLDCGGLNVGSAADLCVFDPSAEFELSAESIKSRGKNTPFVGHHFTGKVRYTLVDGAVVFENEA